MTKSGAPNDTSGTPLVHVLVINWNGLEHLEACFDSLLASTWSNAQFVLVDNGSTDASVAFVQERYGNDPRVRCLECGTNLGWSGGNNVGLRRALEAGADYIFLLNNDTAMAPDALEHCVRMAQSDPGIGAVAPKMVLFDQPDILNSVGIECSSIGAAWDKGVARLDSARWNLPEEVIGACGGACLIRADALEKTGLLPEEFDCFLDDLDLCLRLWNAGYHIKSCPQAQVRHKFSATYGHGSRARRKYYLNTRNRFRLLLRHFPLAKLLRNSPRILLGELRALGRGTLDGDLWKWPAHARAWLAAVRYLPAALRERRRRRGLGQHIGRFWPMVHTSQMFCPGAPIPQNGWYEPCTIHKETFQPMARHAWMDIHQGRLSITLANPHPHLGEVELIVTLPGGKSLRLRTASRFHEEVLVNGGVLHIEACRIFPAEDTGLPMDTGAWLRIEQRV